MSGSRAPLSVFVVPLLAALALGAVFTHAEAQSAPPDVLAGEVIVAPSSDFEWSAGPPSLPEGSEFVLLEGDPSKAVPLTFRLRFPPDYRVPPHWHSVLEHVTVVSGTLHLGLGEEANYSGGTALSAGDFGVLPTELVHYAWTEDEGVEFQLHSNGPWSITYVNEDDDPRNR